MANQYSPAFRRATVEDFLTGNKRPLDVCRERGIDQKTLRSWRRSYHERGPMAWEPATGDGASPGTRPQRYSAAFKLATVEEFLAGEKRSVQICRERGIDATTLRSWRRSYRERGASAWTTATESTETDLESRIATLERVIGQMTVENLVLKKALRHVRARWKHDTSSCEA